MLNKKRQELIIQNLKSIFSQVRLMSVEQLVNLPSFPVDEKLKLLEGCLEDSDEAVQASVKAAIEKLGGDVNKVNATVNTSASPRESAPIAAEFSMPSLDEVQAPSNEIPEESPSPKPSALPSLFAAENNIASSPSSSLPTPSSPLREENVIIDGPVDPALPSVTGQTDIASIIQHIKMLASSRPSGHLTRLFELCKSMHEEVALTALQTLYNLKSDLVPLHMLSLLNDSSYTSQRRFLMLKIVMDTKVSLNVDLLENILINEKDVIVKSGLVKVFARNCGIDGVPLLIRCLNDEDPRVRANTVEVIEAHGIKGCENEIVKMLNDSENRVKVNAAKYLVKIGYQQAFLTLRAMLVSPEVWLRDSVIFALGEIADQPSILLLRAALKDPNQGIRLSVLKALARINNNSSRAILKAATGDPDPVVAQVAISLFDKTKDSPMRADTPVVRPPTPSHMNASVSPNKPVVPQTKENHSVQPPQVVSQQSTMQPEQFGTPMQPAQQSPLPSLVSGQQMPQASPQQLPLPSLGLGLPSSAPVQQPSQITPQQSPLPSLTTVHPSAISAQKPQNMPPAASVAQKNIGLPNVSGSLNQGVSTGVATCQSLGKPVVATPKHMPASSGNMNAPAFAKPRSAEIYAKLCSSSLDEQKLGMKDIAFVMGDDQMILLKKAVSLQDESIRIAAVKLISRKRTKEAREMLKRLSLDTNETISSLAKKTLMILN